RTEPPPCREVPRPRPAVSPLPELAAREGRGVAPRGGGRDPTAVSLPPPDSVPSPDRTIWNSTPPPSGPAAPSGQFSPCFWTEGEQPCSPAAPGSPVSFRKPPPADCEPRTAP